MQQPVPGEASQGVPPDPVGSGLPVSFVVQEALSLCLASAIMVAGEEVEGGAIYLLDQSASHYDLVTWQGFSEGGLSFAQRYSVADERDHYLRLGIPFAVNCRRPHADYPVLLADHEETVTVLPITFRSWPLGSLDLLSRRGLSLASASVERLAPLLGRLTSLARHLRDHRFPLESHCPDVLDHADDLCFVLDLEGRILWSNRAVANRLRRSPEELLGLPMRELHPSRRRREAQRAIEEMVAGVRSTSHIPFLRPDGSLLCAEISATCGCWRGRQVLVAVARHLVECNEATARLRQRQDRLERTMDEQQKRLVEHLRLQNTMVGVSRLLIATGELETSIQQALHLFGQRLGADRAYLFQMSSRDGTYSNTHEWCAPEVSSRLASRQQLAPGDFPWWAERLRCDGRLCIPNVDILPAAASAEQRVLQELGIRSLVAIGITHGGRLRGFVGLDFCQTPTTIRHSLVSLLRLFADALGNALERAEGEQRIRESEKSLRGILADTDALICRFDAEGTLGFVNHAYASFFGHRPEEMVGTNFFSLVSERVRPQVRAAFQSLTPAHPAFVYEQEIRRHDGTLRLQRWTDRAFFSADGAPLHYQSVGIDITDLVHARHEAMESLAQVERALRNAVRALAKTQEIRDPYTAGHQLRVADLSVRIAHRLGMDEQEQSAVYYGALLHDLGKIHIPMDILSKPTRLSAAEYSLIQCHPASGVDILREIQLDESVELITLGHHERLDGSGYPQGLRGEEITRGARIVAVADVVDSMVSHRPYRAALPTADALAEISGHSGTKYDREVVAACLELFGSGNYRFPECLLEKGVDVADSLPPPPLPPRARAPLAPATSSRRPTTHTDHQQDRHT